jgi:hypothetical protein
MNKVFNLCTYSKLILIITKKLNKYKINSPNPIKILALLFYLLKLIFTAKVLKGKYYVCHRQHISKENDKKNQTGELGLKHFKIK